ncbi:hypothetical protein GCM10023347_19460 [Streptomyces chumphonensis]
MELHIDIRWLLESQADVLPKQPSVHDFSALSPPSPDTVSTPPQIGATVDAAWRAAALLHTIIRLRPLPARNALYGAAVAYMEAAGEAVDAPYGALIDLARDLAAGHADTYDAADRLRTWRL